MNRLLIPKTRICHSVECVDAGINFGNYRADESPQVSIQVSSVNDVCLTLLPTSTHDWWLGKKQIRLQLRPKQCYHYHGKIETM